jgi:serine/threonine protein kinase
MNRFENGHVIEGSYRVESVLSETERASVYVVTHVRFPEVPLVLKVAAVSRSLDFERDTAALSTLTTPCVARIRDRGKLPDGRPYRVMQRLVGPTLREALETANFTDARAMEILVALAAAVHEAHANGLGPCDLSLDNLMFADGRAGKLCMIRALVPNATTPSVDADQAALSALRGILEGASTQVGGHEPRESKWKPPSSVEEIRDAMARTGGPRTPPKSAPGTHIERWEVLRPISETLQATVYEVKSRGGEPGILKVAGSECDHGAFTRHADLLARVQSRNVVRVLDFGKHDGTPYMVMEPLYLQQSVRLQRGDPLPIDAAIQTVDELLWGAEAISKYNGSPCDFSLEHCYQAKAEPSPVVLTHAMLRTDARTMLHLRAFGGVGRPVGEHADAWSAAVALYELIAGRLPFPTSKHSLAKAWMGMPIPLGSRRRDVPPDMSELVHDILMGKRVTTAELRRELTRIRSIPAAGRSSSVPERGSVPPQGSVPPAAPANVSVVPGPVPLAPARVFAPTESGAMPARSSFPPPATPVIIHAPDFRMMSEDDVPQRRSIEPPSIAPVRRPDDASVSWTVELAPSRCPLGSLSAAALGHDGEEIVAVARDAVARFRQGQWTVDPARDTAANVVSLLPMGDGGYLGLTSTGPLLRLGPSGGFVPWGVALDRFCFHGAVPERDGFTLLGGTRDKKHAVIARLVGESMTIVTDTLELNTLRGGTNLGDGTLLAVTEGGSIVRFRGPAIVDSIKPCGVDLLAARVVGEEIVVVGAGAWAFRITTSPLAAQLEAVDTRSAFTCLSISGPTVWAGSQKGRILQRVDRHWTRRNRSFEGDPGVIAIQANATLMRAVLADGQVVIGRAS